ncbi:ModD protein [Pararhodospirillum oryzae]|uniref:Putative pyrophosphorylase ModD n=1 Tax=Pararhodospirillum oryzae TaxID=478448 RepID=A0A512HBW3_9PROT|nr:ModD protein [Pararhodospirillum oryzae]GEO82938.1 ModD protein [Pararhodospirillum oryzae]
MICCLSDAALATLLAEDVPHGDLTTEALGIGARPGAMTFSARGAMTLCGIEEAARLITLAGGMVEVFHASGAALAAGTVLLQAEGRADALHRAWKVSQTLIELASGIATRARALVDAAHAIDPTCVVATTRKTFPGTRALAAKAAKAGGASLHRLGLSETILVFAEHRAFLSPEERMAHLRDLKARCPERRIVTEVTTEEEALAAVIGGAEVLQLERFSPAQVEALSALLRTRRADDAVTLAVAGGVTLANIADYVRAGARVLVTSAPYLAPPCDVKVVLGPET